MKKFIIGLSAIAMLGFQSCSDVLDIDPSRSYSESTVYSSVKNLDLYVKDFYGIFYSNADILVGSNFKAAPIDEMNLALVRHARNMSKALSCKESMASTI